ncbi:MAG TPA: prepilin-type N-terminal cleavage/methylation domain-containing protein [Pirellulales bacterium]
MNALHTQLNRNTSTNRNCTRGRRGLTLIELVVVLMIVVALAGVLIPMLPSMLTRAHVGGHTTNVVELDKLVDAYQAMNNAFPDNWDALTDGSSMINYMAGGVLDPISVPATYWSSGGTGSATNQAGGVFTQSSASASELTALQAAGIVHVYPLLSSAGGSPWDGGVFDPTFDNYSTAPGTPTTISTSTALVFIDPTANGVAYKFIQNQYPNWSTSARYVALGIGERCTLIGKWAPTPPVHFSDTQDATPEYSYARYVAIFKVSDPSAPGGINMAQFIGTAAIHSVGPTNLSSEFQNWYQINNGGA